MPSYIPTQVVQKDRNPWEMALISFLANAGGNVVGNMVDNATAPEMAGEFGEQPQSFGKKLLSGPKVGRQEAGQRRQIAAQDKSQKLQIGADAQLARFNALQRMIQQSAGLDADLTREQMAYDRAEAELGQRGQTEALRARQQGLAERGDNTRAEYNATANRILKRDEMVAEAPYRQSVIDKNKADVKKTEADVKKTDAEIQGMQQMRDLMSRLGGGQNAAAQGVTPRESIVRAAQPPRPETDEEAGLMVILQQALNPTSSQQPAPEDVVQALNIGPVTRPTGLQNTTSGAGITNRLPGLLDTLLRMLESSSVQ